MGQNVIIRFSWAREYARGGWG